MKKIKRSSIPEEIRNSFVYLYGAGYTARVCLNALETKDVKIRALIDDDVMKQGTIINSYPVLSFPEFIQNCGEEDKVHVILTSIYGKQIYNKLSSFSNITVWEMYDWYMEILDQQNIACEKHCDDLALEDYKNNTNIIKRYLADKESENVLDGIYHYFKTNEKRCLVEICTEEESYFIKEVKQYLKNRDITLVDAGAYEGELLRAIIASGLKVRNWYCFEVERNNFERLRNNVKGNSLPDDMVCIVENCGLWNKKEKVSVVNQGTASKVSENPSDGEVLGSEVCQMETIDDYFKNIPVDMIKMDIEGAEMQALQGGINTIKRDRPLLAISIYHYVKDYYRIMQFLLDNTGGEGYSYYIRQHAMIYGETILYAIPSTPPGQKLKSVTSCSAPLHC